MRIKDFLVLLTRLFLGYIFLSAGFCKLTHGHFGQLIGPPWLEEKLAQYDLRLFAQVVAYLQVLCGALLLSQRFSTLGAIMLVPMNISILAVTVSQQWQGTPYVNAVFLLLNFLLLFYEWPKLKFLFIDDNFTLGRSGLDKFRSSRFNIAALVLIIPAVFLARAQYYVSTSDVVAVAFLLFIAPLMLDKLLTLIEKLMLGQSAANMVMITLAFKNAAVPVVVGVNTAILATILLVWIAFKTRKKEVIPAP